MSRRFTLNRWSACFVALCALLLPSPGGGALPGGSLDPTHIAKYVEPLVIPPAMPQKTDVQPRNRDVDYYEIAVRQFEQQVLPPRGCGDGRAQACPKTTVWSYGSTTDPATFHYPAFTIAATYRKPVRVKWINDLRDADGNYLRHLLPVDQTLHWANPPGGASGRDMRPPEAAAMAEPYAGPVPIVTHVHGAHVPADSDGYPEAWYLPAAKNIPPGYARTGSLYNAFRAQAQARIGQNWEPGSAVFQYDNDQRAATLWYHDHTLGMTRTNVYAGPAGFYLLRGGPHDEVGGTLPGPAPAAGDEPGTKYYEIPIAIQDRSFNADGSLFYPDTRAFFDGLTFPVTYLPEVFGGVASDIAPIWNPEFFGNTIVVNGRTWPYLEVEQRRYRFRFLNGSQSRFFILTTDQIAPGEPLTFWQIGTEGGFIPKPLPQQRLLLGPAERADVIVDFTNMPEGKQIRLLNLGPDEPFGGGVPGRDFHVADPETTGQVMQFRVVAAEGTDPSTPPSELTLPEITPLPAAVATRQVSLNELDSDEKVCIDEESAKQVSCDELDTNEHAVVFGPKEAKLGVIETASDEGAAVRVGSPRAWHDAITENPALDATEVWEIFNFTADAHPIHIHEVMFEVVDREAFDSTRMADGAAPPVEPWEAGALKDTVIAYPGEITRVKARFDIPGLFVWHCHILEHEDNEMMRPYCVGSLRGDCGIQGP